MRKANLMVPAVVLACAAGCGGLRPFPLQEPLWQEQDKRPFTAEPGEYYSGFLWDGADQMVFRPFTKFWAVDPGGEALNVNSMDEVPDSAWFTNRIGRRPMSPADMRLGACKGHAPLDPAGPWLVTGAKPNGANPGFPIKAADGRRYMVKFDGLVQGPRATASDVIVSKLYHAAGFATPCNEIVEFDRSILAIKEGAESENEEGEKVPLTEADLDQVFSKAIRLPDGRYRASASLFLAGKPIGPFRYEGTRCDDPNDVIPHEDRRELRGHYALAAWVSHTDAREQNTLDMFVEVEGKGGYIQHNIIDFGDCFGSFFEWPFARRIGHSHYLDVPMVLADLVTLGAIVRPWDTAQFGESKAVFGYFQVLGFEPDAWRPGYPNPAMLRRTERDVAWMARILAQLSDAHIKKTIEAGKIREPFLAKELARILIGRRNKLLARYLSRLSPLSWPKVQAGPSGTPELCLTDLAVKAGVTKLVLRKYTARAWLGPAAVSTPIGSVRGGPEACVELPILADSSAAEPRYLIVDVTGYSGSQQRNPARVHLYHLGGSDFRIVGLQRPYDDDPPG